jgi:hydroxyacylglutathione hydrolase
MACHSFCYLGQAHRINDYVTQLLSVPRLGLEHAAYRIETMDAAVWIDCPSGLNRDLASVETN